MEVLTTKAKEFYCNPMITWLNKIKFDIFQNFTFSYNSQVFLRWLTKVFTVTMLHYLFTWSSTFTKYEVATRDQRWYEGSDHFNSDSFGLKYFKPSLSISIPISLNKI